MKKVDHKEIFIEVSSWIFAGLFFLIIGYIGFRVGTL